MTYKETIEYLFNVAPLFQHVGGDAYKEGLSNTHRLDAHFGHPHRAYRTVHVAGTNGKGSCAHTIAAALQAAGLRVGLYTSPHLVNFRERIRVNGDMIPEERVVRFVDEERSFFEPLHPSFFELTTALAFLYFKEMEVDVAVIEVGLGGRLDCTNVITPLLSVITNISLDHTQFLGHTLPAIAREKAGIIKPGIPVVVGETTEETRPVFEAVAREVGAPIRFADEEGEILSSKSDGLTGREYATHHYGVLQGELCGECQVKNAATVLCALDVLAKSLKLPLTDGEVLAKAFGTVTRLTGLRGRWQVVRRRPTVICDTGHNIGGWEYLAAQLSGIAARQSLHIVFGMAGDKDIDSVLALLPAAAKYYFTQASVRRAMPVAELMEIAARHGLSGRPYSTVAEAYGAALADAKTDGVVYVGGSSFVVADLFTDVPL